MRTYPRTSTTKFFQHGLPPLGLVLALAAALSGCSSAPEKSPEPAEIPLGDIKAVDTPEEVLFAEAKRYYATELYTVARDSFRSLATSYALGAYAEFAEIKAADSYFSTNEFETARVMYEEFLKNRPASRAAPYVMMRAGRSFHLSHQGIGRDPQSLEKALGYYDRLIAQYPNSVYADSARTYRAEVVRDLEQSERAIADFYARKKNDRAVAAREEVIAEKWSPLMQVSAPQTGVAVARYMPEIAPAKPMAAPSVEPSPDRRAPLGAVSEKPLPPGVNVVKAACKQGPPAQVFLFLNGEIPGGSLPPEAKTAPSKNGVVTVELPEVSSRGFTTDCLGEGDLRVSATGAVELKSDKGATVMALQNPSRVLLVLDR